MPDKLKSRTCRRQLAQKLSCSPLKPAVNLVILKPKPSISIQKIKTLNWFLSKKTAGLKKIVYLPEAQFLTLPAQNALLKILEEPPKSSLIILCSPKKSDLLATIISRCLVHHLSQNHRLKKPEALTQQKLFEKITRLTPAQKISLAKELVFDRQTAIDFCFNQLLFLHTRLAEKQYHLTFLIKKILKSQKKLQANTNPLLVIENLLLDYPEHQKSDKINLRSTKDD